MWIWQNFENWMQLSTFHQKLQNKEFGWLWNRWGRRVFVKRWTFKCEGERSYHMLHYKQVFGNFFERKARKCCGVLIKHCRKVKGEQVITLQMAQKLKTKNIDVVPGQLFCRQCKYKFLLETDSLYWWSR